MQKHLQKTIGSAAFQKAIQNGTKRILGEFLMAQDTYRSMVESDGELRGELGVVNSVSAMDNLVRDWVASTSIRVSQPRVVGGRITGTIITVRAIQADYQDVLSKAYASYTTEKGDEIPWLEWLLTEGDRILVQAHISDQGGGRKGRTHNTIMVKTKGQGWGIPSEYAGTYEDNYATKAVVEAIPFIEQLFRREVTRIL
jgi:hypothetical protein